MKVEAGIRLTITVKIDHEFLPETEPIDWDAQNKNTKELAHKTLVAVIKAIPPIAGLDFDSVELVSWRATSDKGGGGGAVKL